MSGIIQQGATEISYGERDGRAIVTFLRSKDLSQAATVTFDVTAESATPGTDFRGSSGTVTFAPGQDRATVSFDIVNDALGEPTETFIVSLVATSSGEVGVPRTCRVNILDDERPDLPPAEPPLQSDYLVSMQPLVSGLSQPTNIEFSTANPDVAYVAEKSGLIRAFNVATRQDLGVVIDLRDQVNDYSDRGLLDIALHPDFPAQPYIYAFYVVDPPGAATNGMADQPGNRFSHLVRFTADASADYLRVDPQSAVVLMGGAGRTWDDINGGGVLDFSTSAHASLPSSERYVNPQDPTPPVVINGFKQDYLKVDAMSHAGGALAFGPDGALYVSTGDGGSPNYADPHNADVQNLGSLSGKILRIDPLTGRGLADNPFHQAGQSLDSNLSKVWQLGLRNPFSMGFDDLGQLIIADTGWNNFEEINTGPAGSNFGWPWFEGGTGGASVRTSGYRNLPEAAAFYQAVENGSIVVRAPFAAFGHSAAAPGYQSQAITGGSFTYSGDRYPAAFKGDYFFSDFVSGNIFSIDTADRQDIKFLMDARGTLGPVHYVQGPDGYVYYIDIGAEADGSMNGSIGRLLIFPPNALRVTASAATVTESAGTAAVTFTLSAPQAEAVSVVYYTINGTALPGRDFQRRTDLTATIPAGQTSVTVTVPIVNDATQETTEAFQVGILYALKGSEPIASGLPATITILDDDAVAAPRTKVTMTTTSFVAPDDAGYEVIGTRGADTIVTKGGSDLVSGGVGNDSISTGAGNDVIVVTGAGEGTDSVDGGAGTDILEAKANGTVIRLSALAGVETISGVGFSGVQVAGTAGADSLDLTGVTLAGIAAIDMGAGNDTLVASAGGETILGGQGNDALNAGGGNDTVVIGASAGVDRIDGGAGTDTVLANAANARVYWAEMTGVESIAATAAGVLLLGSGGADTISHALRPWSGVALVDGGAGNDTITGSEAADSLAGGTGEDVLNGLGGNDTFVIRTGSGLDRIDGGAGTDTVLANVANAKVMWAGLSGVEAITATTTGVQILGSGSGDTISHALIAWSGVAIVDGGSGNDSITGGAGDDRIAGRAGADRLDGGAGADDFVYSAITESRSTAIDTIAGFVRGVDDIDLSAIDANATAAGPGNESFRFIDGAGFTRTAGDLRVDAGLVAGQTVVQADVNGDGRADMEIRLVGTLALTGADFVL